VLINDVPEDFAPAEGEMVNILITEAQKYDLVGRVLGGDSDDRAGLAR
jgi:hypothetical protein